MAEILILQPYVPQYRVRLFELLHTELAQAGHRLSVVAAHPPASMAARADSVTGLPFQSLTRQHSLGVRGHRVGLKWERTKIRKADVVVNELGSLVLENYLLALGPSTFAGWGHGYPTTTKPNWLGDRLESMLIRRSDHFFAYTSRGAEEAVKAGLASEQVTTLQNTIDTTPITIARSTMTRADSLKALDLPADAELVCGYVGGLDGGKRVDFLVAACRALLHRFENLRIVIAGAGSGEQKVVAAAAENHRLHYIGRAGPREKAAMSLTSSLLLNPGRVGLVAVDSFAMGLPLATTDWPFHAPEFEYLIAGTNALVSADNLDSYVSAVAELLRDPTALKRMQNACLDAADQYRIEDMVSRFVEGLLTLA